MSLIPNLPAHNQLIKKDGNMHEDYRNFFSQLVTALQQGISDEGFKTPMQSNTNIQVLNTTQSIGGLLYNTDLQKVMLNNSGTYQRAYPWPYRLTTAQITAFPVADINGTWVENTDNNKLFMGVNNAFHEVTYT